MSESRDSESERTDIEAEKMDLLKRFAAQIGEHFSSVRIIATFEDGENTGAISVGVGDWYAQYGATKLWVQDKENKAGEDDE